MIFYHREVTPPGSFGSHASDCKKWESSFNEFPFMFHVCFSFVEYFCSSFDWSFDVIIKTQKVQVLSLPQILTPDH